MIIEGVYHEENCALRWRSNMECDCGAWHRKTFADKESTTPPEIRSGDWLSERGALRAAYADPPYIGQAKKHYADDPRCAEVDHRQLVARLETFDGWALSCSSPSLREILPMCPKEARVGAWVKPFCAFKVNVNPAYAWEPVIFRPARRRTRAQETERDWISEVITLKRGLSGAKPRRFCYWIFEILGLRQGDELHDLFPGTGAVGEAWNTWTKQMSLGEWSGSSAPLSDNGGDQP